MDRSALWQVVCMSFFDIVLDFILMDAFEDLENPPSSVLAVLRNRWLSDSFKETVSKRGVKLVLSVRLQGQGWERVEPQLSWLSGILSLEIPGFPEALNNDLLVHVNCLQESFPYFESSRRFTSLIALISDAKWWQCVFSWMKMRRSECREKHAWFCALGRSFWWYLSRSCGSSGSAFH